MAHDDRTSDLLSFLGRVADSLLETVGDGRGGVLLHVAPAPDGWDIAVKDLEGAPADVLLGFVAPDHWVALGVAAGGWAHRLDAGMAATGCRQPAAVVTIVHRSGPVVGRVRVGDEVQREAPAYGLTLDALQRALGLASAPPLHSTGLLFASTWLENVAGAARGRGRALTWAEARTLHPAIQLLAQEPGIDDVDLVAAARDLERACRWDEHRWMIIEGRTRDRNITPAEAAWFDAGSYSRWAMSWRPEIDDLLADVRRTAGSGVARRCAAVLHRLQLPCGGRDVA